jgi:hypothetical protein
MYKYVQKLKSMYTNIFLDYVIFNAYMTYYTVCDVLVAIDMDGPKDSEGNILDPDFYTSIFSAVVKGCICRPSDNLGKEVVYIFVCIYIYIFIY